MNEVDRARLLELVCAVEPDPVNIRDNTYVLVFNPIRGRFSGQHIAIVEIVLGRTLRKPEKVHHFNGIKYDNARTNLVVCEDEAYHALLHRRQRLVSEGKDPDAIIPEKPKRPRGRPAGSANPSRIESEFASAGSPIVEYSLPVFFRLYDVPLSEMKTTDAEMGAYPLRGVAWRNYAAMAKLHYHARRRLQLEFKS